MRGIHKALSQSLSRKSKLGEGEREEMSGTKAGEKKVKINELKVLSLDI